ncbi:MAG: hypothetical protein JOZ17_14500, partial [Acetobacteraceae bacterium]|nr:hypothetical protein [Acetobacteraceae bacterium]
VEIGEAIGWDNAHHVLYAGALDIAVGPRWYSTYEMACNAVKVFLDGEALHAVPYGGASAREAAQLAKTAPLDQQEAQELTEAIIRQPEPAYLEVLSRLLLAGKGPRRVLDTIQAAAAQVVVETQTPTNFSLPQHCYEYCSTLGWFFDNFEHKQRLKLLYVAASFLNRAAFHQRHTGDLNPVAIRPPSGAERMTAERLLERVEEAVTALDGPGSLVHRFLDRSRIRRIPPATRCRVSRVVIRTAGGHGGTSARD